MCKPTSSRLGRVEADLSIVKREREEEEVAPSLESMGSDAPLPMFHWNADFDDDEWLDFEREYLCYLDPRRVMQMLRINASHRSSPSTNV